MKIAILTLLLIAVMGFAHAKEINLELFDEADENFNEQLSADEAFSEDFADNELYAPDKAVNSTQDLTAYRVEDEEEDDFSMFSTAKDWEFEDEEEVNATYCYHCAETGYLPSFGSRRRPYGCRYINVGRRSCGRRLYSSSCRTHWGAFPGYSYGSRCYFAWGRHRYYTRTWNRLTVEYGHARLRYSRYSFSRCTAFGSYAHHYRDPFYQCVVKHGGYYVPGYGDPYGRWCRDAWGHLARNFYWVTVYG